MSTLKTKPLINFLLVIFKIFHVLFWGASIASFFMMSYALVNYNGEYQSPPDLPVYFEYTGDNLIANWNDGMASTLSILKGLVMVKTDSLPSRVVFAYSFFLCIMCIAILFSIRFTIKILRSVKQQRFFLVKNAVRLRWIGMLGIVSLIAYKLSMIVSTLMIGSKMSHPDMRFDSANLMSLENFEAILASLFLVVISEVFRIGAELKEEQDLTI